MSQNLVKKKVVLFILSHKFSELLMVSVNRACVKSDAGGGLRIGVSGEGCD